MHSPQGVLFNSDCSSNIIIPESSVMMLFVERGGGGGGADRGSLRPLNSVQDKIHAS